MAPRTYPTDWSAGTVQTAVKSVPNAFDYMGLLIGLPRIVGENNVSYKKRLLNVYVDRAGCNYSGLINGLTRELGFSKYNAIDIAFSYPYPTESPRVLIRDSQIDLYQNWNLVQTTENVLLASFDIYSPESLCYTLGGLVEAINTVGYFDAVLYDGVDPNTLSSCLLRQDSQSWIQEEELKPMHRNRLAKLKIVAGTVSFSNIGRRVFRTQKATEELVIAAGDYYVDYASGMLYSYSIPETGSVCRYMYDKLPLGLQASPIIIHNFNSSTFRDKIFEQILIENGSYIEGVPLADAIDYINELVVVKGMTWGL